MNLDHPLISPMYLLRQILCSLPNSRDWLDPQIEGVARHMVDNESLTDIAYTPQQRFDILYEAGVAVKAWASPSDEIFVENALDAIREIRLAGTGTFQDRVKPWMDECFGDDISNDKAERNHRFYEEATELVQAGGMSREDAHKLVDYTYDRPVGELKQEIGGVMVTLAALCLAQKADMHESAEVELLRIWTMVDKIRAKQLTKPKFGPLAASPTYTQVGTAEISYGGALFHKGFFDVTGLTNGTYNVYLKPA